SRPPRPARRPARPRARLAPSRSAQPPRQEWPPCPPGRRGPGTRTLSWAQPSLRRRKAVALLTREPNSPGEFSQPAKHVLLRHVIIERPLAQAARQHEAQPTGQRLLVAAHRRHQVGPRPALRPRRQPEAPQQIHLPPGEVAAD